MGSYTIEKTGCPTDRRAQSSIAAALDQLPGDATPRQRWFLAGLLAQSCEAEREAVLEKLGSAELTRRIASVAIDNLLGGQVRH